jgi:hypothetical protein
VASWLPVAAELLLGGRDRGFGPAVEHELLDLLAFDQAGPGEDLQVLTAGRLADLELLGDEQRADAIADQVAVALRREVGGRIG